MKVRIGNFIYHHRNALFPVFYILLFLKGPLLFGDYRLAAVAGHSQMSGPVLLSRGS